MKRLSLLKHGIVVLSILCILLSSCSTCTISRTTQSIQKIILKDVPVYSNYRLINTTRKDYLTRIVYTSNDTWLDICKFYIIEMEKLGWELDKTNSPLMTKKPVELMSFSKSEKTCQILVTQKKKKCLIEIKYKDRSNRHLT